MTDFRSYAHDLSVAEGAEGLLPVIEKELVHYEILRSLSEHGHMAALVFQGGACLRLCHGSARHSEDLCFTAGDNFGDLDLDGMVADLQDDLLNSLGVKVRVEPPKPEGPVGVRTWTAVVATAPARPGLPPQKIRLGVAPVPARAVQVLPLGLNHRGLPASYASVIVPCQTREEILAEKALSFACSGRTRYRDLWDIPWLLGFIGPDNPAVLSLVVQKHSDYRCSVGLGELMGKGAARACEAYRGNEFARQMRRFLPRRAYDRTVGSPDYVAEMARRTQEMYACALRAL